MIVFLLIVIVLILLLGRAGFTKLAVGLIVLIIVIGLIGSITLPSTEQVKSEKELLTSASIGVDQHEVKLETKKSHGDWTYVSDGGDSNWYVDYTRWSINVANSPVVSLAVLSNDAKGKENTSIITDWIFNCMTNQVTSNRATQYSDNWGKGAVVSTYTVPHAFSVLMELPDAPITKIFHAVCTKLATATPIPPKSLMVQGSNGDSVIREEQNQLATYDVVINELQRQIAVAQDPVVKQEFTNDLNEMQLRREKFLHPTDESVRLDRLEADMRAAKAKAENAASGLFQADPGFH